MTLTRLLIAATAGTAAAACPAQVTVHDLTPIDVGVVEEEPPDPALLALNRRSFEIEKELRRLRHEHFRIANDDERRYLGLVKLRGYTEPAAFEPMLEVFADADVEVQEAVIDHLSSLETEAAQSAVAWAAVFSPNEEMRLIAADALVAGEPEEVSYTTKVVIAAGLEHPGDGPVRQAADLANRLNLYEAIPMLISAQVGSSANTSDGGGALGQIWVGTQQAFVSDLTPVVADNAVAFDPTISVITNGVVLRVTDAAVVTYRTEVNRSLVGLSSRAWGRSTEPLGFDQEAWRAWYADEFLPGLAARDAAKDLVEDSQDEIDRFDW